jgi:hypothetical protein
MFSTKETVKKTSPNLFCKLTKNLNKILHKKFFLKIKKKCYNKDFM